MNEKKNTTVTKDTNPKDNGKDMRLIRIYLKIHNKKSLTIDDLSYLAKYNPECFQKTCDQLLGRMPESKPLFAAPQPSGTPQEAAAKAQTEMRAPLKPSAEELYQSSQCIQNFLDKMRTVESGEIAGIQHVDLEQVKGLVGNLYMEFMFPDTYTTAYFKLEDSNPKSTFSMRA